MNTYKFRIYPTKGLDKMEKDVKYEEMFNRIMNSILTEYRNSHIQTGKPNIVHTYIGREYLFALKLYVYRTLKTPNPYLSYYYNLDSNIILYGQPVYVVEGDPYHLKSYARLKDE